MGTGVAAFCERPKLTERSIEVPWVAANVPQGTRKALDVGAVNAQYHEHIRAKTFVKLDLRYARPDEEPTVNLLADSTQLPFASQVFNLIVCISSIEHFGQRSVGYGTKRKPGYRERAVGEIRRVLRWDGLLLVTAPFGKAADMGWQIVFDARSWEALWPREHWRRCDEFFILDGHYKLCGADDLRGTEYDKRNGRAAGVVCSRLWQRGRDDEREAEFDRRASDTEFQ
jgi:SAM-dependent methyltransferase